MYLKISPITIKYSQTFNIRFIENITYFKELIKARYALGYLTYSGNQEQSIEGIEVMNDKKEYKLHSLLKLNEDAENQR